MPKREPKERRISHTRGSVYMACGKLYDAVYNKKLEQSRNLWMIMGTVVHAALEELNTKAMKEAEKAVDRRHEIGVDDVDMAFDAAVAEHSIPGDIDSGNMAVLYDSLEQHARKVISKNGHNIIAVEQLIPLEYRPGVILTVKPDLVSVWEDGHEITDYKSGENILSKQQLRDEKQINTYALADLMMNPHIRRFKFTQWMLRYDFPNSVIVDADEVRHIRRYLNHILRGMDEKIYEPRVNAWCDGCPVRSRCKAYREKYLVHGEAPGGLHKAHEELKALAVSLLLGDRRKKILRNYIAHKCRMKVSKLPVEKGTMAWGYYPTEGFEVDVGAEVELYKEYGLNIVPLMDNLTKTLRRESDKQLFRMLPQDKIDEFSKKREALEKRTVKTRLDCRPVK